MYSSTRRTPMFIVLLVSAVMAGFLAEGAKVPRERFLWALLAVACVGLAGRSLVNFFRTGE
ncbi:MAG: hypothetical protein U0269_01495 [Polyangiales bacterium]